MIERLLAAFAEGAGDGGAPRTDVGAEEIADILWLAARVDAAAPPPRAQDGPAAGTAAREPGPPSQQGPVPVPGPTGAPPDGSVQLFPANATATVREPARAADAGGRRGVPLRLPRTASLDDPLALMRSLRPVGRRSIGGPGEELDEQLTVERSIECMVPTPVLRPAESRWLDLALVVDTHHSMLLWSDLVAELRGILTRSGVFRDVRTWQLTGTGPGHTPMLARSRGGPPRNPLELADPAGRRLILVVSDTVADGWQQAPLRGILRHWSTHNAVAVLNVLPERLWTRGAVRPVPFAVRCDRPAAATRSWQRVPAARRSRGGGPVVPVVGIASGSLARLVRVVSGDGRWRRLACLRLDAAPVPAAAPPPGGLTALEAVERFRAAASPTAQQLAAHLAAVPLTLPVMTLVRRSLLRGSEHGHLAEVALGGLFAPWGDTEQPLEGAEFEFLPGVREVLLGSQLRGDVAAVRELVRRRVWEYLSRHRGTGPDFSATRVTDGTEGRRHVPDRALPFAERPRPDDAAPERPEPGTAVPEQPEPVGAAPDRSQPERPRPPLVSIREEGLAHRVVRVRFEPSAEPREVGTLLGPRLVLTAGHVARPGETVAWVRPGGREIACRALWWDEGTPRVFLLESEEDLVDPESLAPLSWTAAKGRAVVDGATDQGEPVALTGELAADDGGRNGELVRLSAEPEDWTHYRGGPVSYNGMLAGVVHGVWPDRMVFLSGPALLEDEGFRTALGAVGRPPHGTRDPGFRMALTVRAGEGIRPHGTSAREQLTELLIRAMADAAVPVRISVQLVRERTVTVLLDAPAALAQAGRLLTALPRAASAGSAAWPEGMTPPLAVALDIRGDASADPSDGGLLGHERVRRHLRATWPPAEIVLVLRPRLREQLAELLGPRALSGLERLGTDTPGWIHPGPPDRLADLMTEAEDARSDGDNWPRCGFDASPDRPSGCAGIRIPGRSRCLAHLPPDALDAHLNTLGAGSPVDYRGTTFTGGLLLRVLDALREGRVGPVRLGAARFTGAVFEDAWEGAGAVLDGEADFTRARFAAGAHFDGAAFRGEALFRRAEFADGAAFDGSEFAGRADFRDAVFRCDAEFGAVTWRQETRFSGAVVEGATRLHDAAAHDTADFSHMLFMGPTDLGAAAFMTSVSFAHAVWESELSAPGARFHASVFEHVVCQGAVRFTHARFDGPAGFSHSVFEEEVGFHSCAFRDGLSFDHAVFSGAFRWERTEVLGGGAGFSHALFEGPALFQGVGLGTDTGSGDSGLRTSVSFDHARFEAGLTLRTALDEPAVRTDATRAEAPDLPDGWTATESDGTWQIRPPHPSEPGGS
ncbi:SAV_2336 N-terminal domain-related protein [Streptomyces sp. NPDC059564]|uniref:SAV_2336 N-terminal domain-related protein n=1 Tax=Streptomyces sp. NPDC059564 TaxID=3346865 RepID=UPI0036AA8C7F